MTWILVNDDGKESDPFDSRDDAVDEKQSLEQIGASLELREVDDASESDDEPEDNSDDIEAEVIEMSGGDGGNENGQDDDEDLEIIGDGGRPYVYCDNCGRLSTCAYRCPDSACGADLAGKPFYRGGDDE